MTRLLILTFILYSTFAFGQKKACYCEKDKSMNGATVSCETKILSSKEKLYWQFNCNKIWLTLENTRGQKFVIDEVPVELYGYTYRLGFHFIKEFSKTILFRSGCPANGPCIYTLIDKTTGKKVEEFNQLICIDTDVIGEDPHPYSYEFVVYLSNKSKSDTLVLYYVDSKKSLYIPFEDKLTALIPQQQFDEMTLDNNTLTFTYELDNGKKKTLSVDLSDKKYSR